MSEKILIVDDDLDTLKLVGLMLKRQGYSITAASTGNQALQKASEDRPNLILLDVMMPDMDGYEVTRRLRNNPDLAHIPIIMFTAKTMVDDKVAGFEAGVDDYMTKPTHPAELVSRVKSLLTQSGQTTSAAPVSKGQIIGVLGAKGGIGVTTLVINLGVAIAQYDKKVIVCELRPGQGTMGLQLGLNQITGVSEMLNQPTAQITPDNVEKKLVTHKSGIQVMLSSYDFKDTQLVHKASPQAEALVLSLAAVGDYLVVDLGAGLNEMSARVIPKCDRVILIVDPIKITLQMAQALLDNLENIGVSRNQVAPVMVNRVQFGMQLTRQQIEDKLGDYLWAVVTPVPEMAYQATESGTPMVLIRPKSQTTQQFNQLAKAFVEETPSDE